LKISPRLKRVATLPCDLSLNATLQAHRQEIKWVFFVKKMENGGGVFFVKKVENGFVKKWNMGMFFL